MQSVFCIGAESFASLRYWSGTNMEIQIVIESHLFRFYLLHLMIACIAENNEKT